MLRERRHPPAFATASGLRGRCVGFLKTAWHSAFARRFARATTIWGHHRAARAYVLLMCLLVGLIAATTGTVACWIAHPSLWPSFPSTAGMLQSGMLSVLSAEWAVIGVALLCGIGGGLIPAIWMLIVGLFLSRFGLRDMADRVVILCYATTWLLVPILLGIGGGWTAYGIIEGWELFDSFRGMHDVWGEVEAAIWLACLLPAIVTLVTSFRRVHVMLRHTRYANA